MSKSSSSGGGIGFFGLLAILFIGLKLTHFIDWSWWWVLAPLWVLPAFVMAVFLVIGILWGSMVLAAFLLGLVTGKRVSRDKKGNPILRWYRNRQEAKRKKQVDELRDLAVRELERLHGQK
jgi:hypothetical protein